MITLRTPENQKRYDEAKEGGALAECPLCKKVSLKEFVFWRVVKNNFPYDVIASHHDMLVSVRHTTETELTDEEYQELRHIKAEYIPLHYGYIMEAMPQEKSIPGHAHLHLIIIKD